MNFKWKRPDMVHEAAKTGGKNVFLEILMFFVVFLVTEIVMAIPLTIGQIVLLAGNEEFTKASLAGDVETVNAILTEIAYSEGMMAVNLFATIIMIAMPMLFCKLIQKRKMRTLGFKKSGMWKEYVIGMLVGFGMMAGIVLICVVTGAAKLSFNGGLMTASGIGMLLVIFIGFLIQGMSEEVMCRGYFLVSGSRKSGKVWLGVFLNSFVFGALHLANPGITILSFVNLILYGIFASVYFVKRGSIWGVAAIHSIWNFTQGNVFGFLVSGQDFGTTLFTCELNSNLTILNGGEFGIEGGILTTIVMTAGILIMLSTKQKDVVEPEVSNMITEAEA